MFVSLHLSIFVVYVAYNNTRNYIENTQLRCLLSEGLLQAEAVEHFAGDNDHGNH